MTRLKITPHKRLGCSRERGKILIPPDIRTQEKNEAIGSQFFN